MSAPGPDEPGPFDGALRRVPAGPAQGPGREGIGDGREPQLRPEGRHRFAYAIVGLLVAA